MTNPVIAVLDDRYITNKLEHATGVLLNWFNSNLMQANPNKFHYILFNRNNANEINSICVTNMILESKSDVKLLGVHIDSKLSFDLHVSEICKRAGRKLNVLGRLSKTLDVKAKFMLFNSFVLSNFNLCPVVWHYCNITNLKKIENIQKRALRLVFGNFKLTYPELRQKASRPLLYIERLRLIVCEVFKCVNELGPSYLHNIFNSKEQKYNTRKTKILEMPKYNYERYGKQSLSYNGAQLWNMLNNDFKNAINVNDFKRLVTSWDGPSCSCSYCNLCVLSSM